MAGAAVRVGEPGFVDGRLVWVVTPPSTAGNAVVVEDENDGLGFEPGYLSMLVGDAGTSRSPLSRPGAMAGSVLIVQGRDDDAVDPADTARLVEGLGHHLADVTSVVVPGEGHGFRTAAGRALALGHELEFYERLTVTRLGQGARYDSSTCGAIELPGDP